MTVYPQQFLQMKYLLKAVYIDGKTEQEQITTFFSPDPEQSDEEPQEPSTFDHSVSTGSIKTTRNDISSLDVFSASTDRASSSTIIATTAIKSISTKATSSHGGPKVLLNNRCAVLRLKI